MNAEDVRRQLAEARAALRDSQRVTQDMLRAWAAVGGPLLRTRRIRDGATPHEVAAAVKELVDSHALDVTLVEGLNQTVAKLEDEIDQLRAAAPHDHQDALEQAELRRRAEAERDRLRAAAETFKDNALDVGTELESVKAERDRLRAVVEAARAYRNAVDHPADHPSDITLAQYVNWGERLFVDLGAALDALDVSDPCICPTFDPEITPFTLYDAGCRIHDQREEGP